MPEFIFKNFTNEIVTKQKVSLSLIKLIEDCEKEITNYNNGISIPFYFDCSKNIKVKRLLKDYQKSEINIETVNVAFPINDSKGARASMIYLRDINPIKEYVVAHEICHSLLYARGFKIVKHKEKKFDAFEGQVISFAHHFPLREVLKKYNLQSRQDIQGYENIIKRNIEIMKQQKYDGSNKAINTARTFQCLEFSYDSDRAARRRVERLMKSLPPEICNKYKAIRSSVSKMSATELITPSGCMKIMIEILTLYEVEDEFIKDFDGFDDYLVYEEMLGK